MIILEGCDGAGKTTLLNFLAMDLKMSVHPRFSTSKGGPVTNLWGKMVANLREWDNLETQLFDRHPLISEPIYASLLKRKLDQRFVLQRREMDMYLKDHAIVVFCLPPLGVVRQNVLKEEQMPGVVENLDKLYALYQQRAIHSGLTTYIYDYTQPDSYKPLLNRLKNYIEEKTDHEY